MRRRTLLFILTPLALFASAAAIGCCAFSAPGYEGPMSDHFDGRVFQNPSKATEHGTLDLMRWLMSREQGPWRVWVDEPPGPRPPDRVGGGDLRVTFVNHATTLVQVDGLNILTDPIYSERASPVSFAGPKRVRAPGIPFDALPKIDVVVVSHNHYDHFDLATLRRLAERDRPRIIVGLGNGRLLEREGIAGGEELDWWASKDVGPGLTVTAVPAEHFSARGTCDRNQTLWAGYVIAGPSGRVYFAGDTGTGDHFRQIGERFGPLRLAILPIGAYEPRWFMAPVHVSPAESVAAHQALRASTSLAMHFGTFPLADDAELEPVAELKKALEKLDGPGPRFWVLGFGEGRMVPPVDAH
jgi:L-ascorbate metabolism protein UlaG (beta-lactamase superfamily)